jgi:hypothetical protein
MFPTKFKLAELVRVDFMFIVTIDHVGPVVVANGAHELSTM